MKRAHRALLASVATVASIVLSAVHIAAEEPRFSHTVFFSLTKDTKSARKVLIDACRELVAGHEGVIRFLVA